MGLDFKKKYFVVAVAIVILFVIVYLLIPKTAPLHMNYNIKFGNITMHKEIIFKDNAVEHIVSTKPRSVVVFFQPKEKERFLIFRSGEAIVRIPSAVSEQRNRCVASIALSKEDFEVLNKNLNSFLPLTENYFDCLQLPSIERNLADKISSLIESISASSLLEEQAAQIAAFWADTPLSYFDISSLPELSYDTLKTLKQRLELLKLDKRKEIIEGIEIQLAALDLALLFKDIDANISALNNSLKDSNCVPQSSFDNVYRAYSLYHSKAEELNSRINNFINMHPELAASFNFSEDMLSVGEIAANLELFRIYYSGKIC
ncbi:MAG: hypothetical protein J7L14_02975 [Candidatus Diapherotrites archaeon]|nr:hypothetical protein [Candidatus Diapherotrites archaeon]